MAKKKVNKGLIAGLTAGAMFLAIGLVGLASIQAAKRDPEVFASQAREMEKAGQPENLLRAADFYRSAYRIRKNPEYIIAAARCEFGVGDIGKALAMLREAFTLDPTEPSVPAYALEMLWRVRDEMPQAYAAMREHAEQLLTIDPNNVLGLVAQAESANLMVFQDPNLAKPAAESLEKAVAIAPRDPRVAVSRVRRDLTKLQTALNAERAGTATPEQSKLVKELSANTIDRLRESIEAHPKSIEPVLELARVFDGLGRTDDAIDLLARTATALPGEALVHIRLATTSVRHARNLRQKPGFDSAKVDALLAQAAAEAERCVQIEPLLFDSYIVLANCKLLATPDEGTLTPQQVEAYKQALAIYRQGLESTVKRQSLQGVLAEIAQARAQMISIAFDSAAQLFGRGPDQAARDEGMKQMQYFVDQGVTQYPTVWRTALMEGEFHLRTGDQQKAIAAFKRLDEQAAREPGLKLPGRHSRERLAQLYEQAGERGSANAMLDAVLESYAQDKQNPPAAIGALRIRLLLKLDEAQKALDAAELFLKVYPNDKELLKHYADALFALKRDAEGRAVLEKLRESGEGADKVAAILAEARLLAAREKYDDAIKLVKPIIDADAENFQAISLLAAILSKAGRGPEGAAYLTTVRQKHTAPDKQRLLDTYITMLGTSDAAARDEQLLKIIQSIPDELERKVELFTFYLSRGKLAEAQPLLDDLEKARPDDARVKQQQFTLALRRKDFARAGDYALKLKQANVDGVSGRLFYAELYMAQAKYAEAYTELAAAERQLPADSSIRVRMAQCLLVLTPPKRDEALTLLKDAISADPMNFLTNKLLYIVYEDMGRRSDGIDYLKQAAKLNPNDEFIRERKQYLDEEADPRSGISGREKMREKDPNNLDVAVRLIELYSRVLRDRTTAPEARPGLIARAGECVKTLTEAANPPAGTAVAVAEFFTAAEQKAEGAAWLRGFIERRSGRERLAARTILARFLERNGERDAAQAELQEIIRSVPSVVTDPNEAKQATYSCGVELVEFLSRTKQLPAMIEASEKLAQTETDVERLKQLRGAVIQALVRGEEFAKAEEAIEKYRKQFPDEPRGALLRSQMLLARPETVPEKRLASVTEAREHLTRLQKEKTLDPLIIAYLRGAAALELVRYHNQRNMLSEAREDLLTAKRLSPSGLNMAHRSTLVQYYETVGDLPLAAAELREMLELRPDDLDLLTRLYQVYLAADQAPKAQAYVAERASRDPNNPLWPAQLAKLLIDIGQHAAAIKPLTEARRLRDAAGSPDPAVIADLFFCMNKAQRSSEVVRMFEALDPAQVTPPIRAHAARAYFDTKKPDKSLAQLEQGFLGAVRSGLPDDMKAVVREAVLFLGPPDMNPLLARVLQQTGNETGALILQNMFTVYLLTQGTSAELARAKQMNEDVVKRAPPGSPAHLGALLIGAQIDSGAGDDATAKTKLEKVLEYDQNYVEAVNNLAYMLVDRLNRPADALPYAARLQGLLSRTRELRLADAETQATMYDTLGWVNFANDRLGPAEAALVEAVRLSPRMTAGWLHLGMVQAKAGRLDDARRSLKKALDLSNEQNNEFYRKQVEAELKKLAR